MAAVSGGRGVRGSGAGGPGRRAERLPQSADDPDQGGGTQILAKLQQELLERKNLAYITKAVEREVKKSAQATPKDGRDHIPATP